MTTDPCDCVRLREQVRVMREALERIVNTSDWYCRCQYIESCNHADSAAKACGSIAEQALNQKEML